MSGSGRADTSARFVVWQIYIGVGAFLGVVLDAMRAVFRAGRSLNGLGVVGDVRVDGNGGGDVVVVGSVRWIAHEGRIRSPTGWAKD